MIEIFETNRKFLENKNKADISRSGTSNPNDIKNNLLLNMFGKMKK